MPAIPRPPSTLRLTRPYGSEDEFIARDASWFGRASITLPHAAARPIGELIRFEIVLESGATVLRGEGPVLAHHPEGGMRPPGLEVRFARIDARSKVVLDRVRASRAAGRGPEFEGTWPSLAPSALASLAPSALPSLAPSPLPSIHSRPSSLRPSSMVSSALPLASSGHAALAQAQASSLPAPGPVNAAAPAALDRASERSGVHVSHAARLVEPPSNREEILARMRERAQRLQTQGVIPYKKRETG